MGMATLVTRFEFGLRGAILAVVCLQALAAGSALSAAMGVPVDLLSPKNGGQLAQASSDQWTAAIDGREEAAYGFADGQEAVFGFENGAPARFSKFAMLITGGGANIKEFELPGGR